VANEDSQDKKVILARYEIKSLQTKGVKVMLQWVPSHCGLLGNEKADYLAKLGSHTKKQPPNRISFHSAKTHIKAAVRSQVKDKWNTESKEIDWETLIKRNSESAQNRKAEVTSFRLNTGHDLRGKHRKRFNIVDSENCKLCNIGIQDREHLRSCSALQDKFSDIDNFENMRKAEKESVCYWLSHSMMA
jgi:hypothetical protein